MRTTLLASILAGLAFAAPRPQAIDFNEIDSAPVLTAVGPPISAVDQPVRYNAAAAASSAAAAVATDPVTLGKRSVDVNAACAPQPDGYGPKAFPDTTGAFVNSSLFTSIAISAPTPPGYQQSFSNLKAAVNANTYLGLATFQTYDTVKCQQLCDAADLCTAFNIYIERDPSVNPASGCDDPPSITNFKCTLWGSGVTAAAAVNSGQYRDQFHVVIAGSNVELGGAIDAPVANGLNTTQAAMYYPGPYNPQICAAACLALNTKQKGNAKQKGDTKKADVNACVFFNSYVLSIANVPAGTYCSLYSQPWAKSYSTNHGQLRGDVYYGISSSYAYTLQTSDSSKKSDN
ncbi:MAG: hypothetical protein M1830_007443 [Pleopsidium flavum]|nr:MAG: hypothetical protein M1830_007443 [Pleopsidium flavum]